MPPAEPRIPPLSPAEFTPEQAELLGAWSHLTFSRVIARRPEHPWPGELHGAEADASDSEGAEREGLHGARLCPHGEFGVVGHAERDQPRRDH